MQPREVVTYTAEENVTSNSVCAVGNPDRITVNSVRHLATAAVAARLAQTKQIRGLLNH